MRLFLGIDAGTVSLKWVLTGPTEKIEELAGNSGGHIDEIRSLGNGRSIAYSRYSRIKGSPVDTIVKGLKDLASFLDPSEISCASITGASSALVSEFIGIREENEFKALAAGVAMLHPGVLNIFEMGGENSRYVKVSDSDDFSGIMDFETNGECAAGTGAFIDQQASRLCFRVEDTGEAAVSAQRCPRIAGRCSVFAKSDMIHAQQKGFGPDEVMRGLCEAVARNFKSNITKGRKIEGRSVFTGGVAMNVGVATAMRELFGLGAGEFIVPDKPAWTGAVGAAVLADEKNHLIDNGRLKSLIEGKKGPDNIEFSSWKPLSREKVSFLRSNVREWSAGDSDLPVNAWLGIDVGSVSTNLALIDDDGAVIHEIYLRTKARPIEAVARGLTLLEKRVGDMVKVRGVGTTGSGRELIGELVGADTVNDEITAHKTGALVIGRDLLGKKVDTIFEIGGQDSKYIRIDDGVVVDFAMNEACAAGTGSFLEEQAERLNIDIVDEFSEMAFSSSSPIRLGERCTVYMEQDVISCMRKGAYREDLVGGLAYSIVQNYLNRVVRGRKIGETIFFQGGTAYNDSVAAAFSAVLDREIVVPPHNGVIGAIGSALLAREKMQALGKPTTFRGYDIASIDYKMREFTCKGCSNYCEIQEFTVENERTYWGDKCSDRYRKRKKLPVNPVGADLTLIYRDLLDADYGVTEIVETDRPRIGLPRTMFYFDRAPFWRAYFQALGFEVVASEPTRRDTINSGIEQAVAEPCAPVQVAHGHIAKLVEDGVDYIFVPNVIDEELDPGAAGSYVCPWGQTLPFVARQMTALDGREDMMLCPTVHFRDGEKTIEKELYDYMKESLFKGRHGATGSPERPGRKIARTLHRKAVRAAYSAQNKFLDELSTIGREAIRAIEKAGKQCVVIVGRPYNIFDSELNLDIPSKLRDYYGVDVIPMSFLPLDGIDIDDITDNMFWNYGRRILQAARYTAERENMHLIYLTNFKCGPDSYIKHFCNAAAGRPWLTLQFDAHGNDAGILTRCEAYLESKGVLSWWKTGKIVSGKRLSISPECQQEERKPLLRRSGTSE
ncbi:MAG: hypothetical protein KAV42_10515 [Candidatus Krumholzibacteria bacterium]|nr:hypothetical protein [Candidatus Krumholzibacteria bacterium]